MIPSKLVDYILEKCSINSEKGGVNTIKDMGFSGVEPVHFNLSIPLQKNIPIIRRAMEIWKSYIQIEVLDTDKFGKAIIKSGKPNRISYPKLGFLLTLWLKP